MPILLASKRGAGIASNSCYARGSALRCLAHYFSDRLLAPPGKTHGGGDISAFGWGLLPGAPALTRARLAPRLSGRTMVKSIVLPVLCACLVAFFF